MATTAKHIRSMYARDIRFPTSLVHAGSDAMHPDPDYSCAHVTLFTDTDMKGYGFAFTIGRGTEIVVAAMKSLARLVVGKQLKDIFDDFGSFWHQMVNESQLRWVGPEKGVIHLATSAIVNALWDLWAKTENKPLWVLLVDMEPEKLLSTVDFTYLTDVITKEEALEILRNNLPKKREKIHEIMTQGYPAYTPDCGWIGYSHGKIKQLCFQYLAMGFTKFKLKIGTNLEDDKKRCAVVREAIGWNNVLILDASQRWDVTEAIAWVTELAQFKPLWIEEPTSSDDIVGHAAIAKELNKLGITVATGEHCHNRVMFKQFLKSGAMQVCRIDGCRLGGVNEIISVLLMAAKFNVPVCPVGNVALCELAQHLMFFDFVCITGTMENRMIEYTDRWYHYVESTPLLRDAHFIPSTFPGYTTSMWKLKHLLVTHEFPIGIQWRTLKEEGKFVDPSLKHVEWIRDNKVQMKETQS